MISVQIYNYICRFKAKQLKQKSFRKSFRKHVSVEEVSQLGCVDSGSKLYRQQKGPWSLGG